MIGSLGIHGSEEKGMWRYLVLGIPLLGLVLFFVLSFELALFLYLLMVGLGFFLYYKLQERMETARSARVDDPADVGFYRKQ
jgi:hypothetical protein